MQHATDRRSSVSYYDCSWWSYLTFGWVNTLVETGVQRQVTQEDVHELGEKEDALVNTRALLDNLDEAERARQSHPLLRALVWAYWPQFLILQSLRVAAHFLGLMDPLLMARVLVFQERQNRGEAMSPEETRIGFTSVSALIALGFFMIFFNTQMQFFQYRLAVRIGSALRGAVLFRCIQGQQGVGRNRANGPSAYNVISFDIDPIVDIIWIALAVWLFPFQFITTLYVLFQHVGWAVVPGVCVIIVAKLVCTVLLYRDGLLRHQLLEAKDRRLRYCSEGFSNIRTLHMLAWREPFQKQIMDARVHELHAQKMRLWMIKMAAALDYSLSMIVTCATLGYYVRVQGGQLKASVALPVIQLIVNLMGPIGQIPTWMNQYMVWRSAYDRLTGFVGLDNHPSEQLDDQYPEVFGRPDGAGNQVARLKDCSLSWGCVASARGDVMPEGKPLLEQSSFELQSLDVGVDGGQLLVVVGLEGQGKSSMLLGLLGEMNVKSGTAHSPAITRHMGKSAGGASLPGLSSSVKAARKLTREDKERQGASVNPMAVPFSEQNAMLFTGSIRWNILFGSPCESSLYDRVLRACALEEDIATMPAGDMTEVAQSGATLSGGQRRRISLARAVYHAALALQQHPDVTPLVLLDDPLCSLDKNVAEHVSAELFGVGGLLAKCAVVVATADPWWVGRTAASAHVGLRVALLRGGCIAVAGGPQDMQGKGFAELDDIAPVLGNEGGSGQGSQGFQLPQHPTNMMSNPQGDEEDEVLPDTENIVASTGADASKKADSHTQTDLTEAQKEALHVVKEEDRDAGQVKWSTYEAYGCAVGMFRLVACAAALVGIMVFQNFCNLWIAYWTAENKSNSFVYKSLHVVGVTAPEDPKMLLKVFATLVICFTICNFLGHAMEIIGGIRAATTLFKQALVGAFDRPFRWWDANPTGRVLNRFSEDVNVMDQAITNIMGVIFGALLYFAGHTIVLAIANPWSLFLLPLICGCLEYYAQYYRMTIREVHRIFRVKMGLLYQDMLEAIVGRVTVRSFARENQVVGATMDNLDRYQQLAFCKLSLALWLGLRMALVGYILSFWVKLRPILQYYGVVGEQSAALVGFSMMYSTETVNIIQQFITNYSDLEMQLISIERLGAVNEERQAPRAIGNVDTMQANGLQLRNVTVTYREGLLPALIGVSLRFSPGEVVAIMGRTGAGKSSLLLSILQLVPHEGEIAINGQLLENLPSEDVRRRLVGIVPQQPVLFEGSLRWNLDPDGLRSEEELWAALASVGLEGKCRSSGGLTASVAGSGGASSTDSAEKVEFSMGQQQMLCAARALLRQPKVVMLDEVASSLPAEAASNMVATLVRRFKDLNTTVLLVTHQEALLTSCERVVKVAAGRVVADERL